MVTGRASAKRERQADIASRVTLVGKEETASCIARHNQIAQGTGPVIQTVHACARRESLEQTAANVNLDTSGPNVNNFAIEVRHARIKVDAMGTDYALATCKTQG